MSAKIDQAQEKIDKRYEQIEFERGKRHAEEGKPPSCRHPTYLEGYEAGGGRHIIPTSSILEQLEFILDRLKNSSEWRLLDDECHKQIESLKKCLAKQNA